MTGRYGFETAYHHQQGALAAARRAENGDELPARHTDYREQQIIDAIERNLLGFTEYSASKEKNDERRDDPVAAR